MARAFDDDLRRKFLAAHARGDMGLRKLAECFGVGYDWGRKVLRQKRRTGQTERVRHRPGPHSRMTPAIADYIRAEVAAQADLTLAELQQRLLSEKQIRFSIGWLWELLRKLGLRLKKSRSTPPNATRKRTASGARSSSIKSARHRRNA